MRRRVKDTWWGKKAHGHMIHGVIQGVQKYEMFDNL